jgi:hypothetical protein
MFSGNKRVFPAAEQMESQEHRKKAAYSPNLFSPAPSRLESERERERERERVARSEHGNLMKNGRNVSIH